MDLLVKKIFVTKAEPKEAGEPGEFVALVSAFGNVDAHGDVIRQGAFTKTLAEWVVKDRPIPTVWSHQWDEPDSFIGEYTDAQETEQGLLLAGILDVDTNPRAARIWDLMKRRRIVEFSIGGRVRDYELVEKDDGTVELHITDLDLFEAGPCFKGANSQTELVSVKNRVLANSAPTSPDPAAPVKETSESTPVELASHVRAALDLMEIQ